MELICLPYIHKIYIFRKIKSIIFPSWHPLSFLFLGIGNLYGTLGFSYIDNLCVVFLSRGVAMPPQTQVPFPTKMLLRRVKESIMLNICQCVNQSMTNRLKSAVCSGVADVGTEWRRRPMDLTIYTVYFEVCTCYKPGVINTNVKSLRHICAF